LESDWVNLEVADVELPDGRHLTTTSFVSTASPPRPPSATTRAECCCCGDTGSSPTAGAGSCHPAGATQVKNRPRPPVARILEETGWAPGPLTLLCAYGADVGIGDARFHLYQAAGATLKGPPADTTEAARVAWIPSARFVNCLIGGQVDDGASITALLSLLAFASIGTATPPAETVPEPKQGSCWGKRPTERTVCGGDRPSDQ
jgi:hypothetical protein